MVTVKQLNAITTENQLYDYIWDNFEPVDIEEAIFRNKWGSLSNLSKKLDKRARELNLKNKMESRLIKDFLENPFDSD